MNIIKTKSFELATYTKGDQNSYKVAVLLPGRLDTKDYINFVSHAEYLAGRGFFVVAFDPPGTWDSPGGIDLFSTTNYIKAVNEVVEYYGNRPTLLLGHSRGATTAVIVGALNKNVIGIILVMANYGAPTAPSDKSTQAGFHTTRRDLPPGDRRTEKQQEFSLPLAYFEDGKKYDVVSYLEKCTQPKLLVHGNQDRFTTSEEVEKVYEIIPEPKMMTVIDSDHDYRRNAIAIKEVEKEVGKFLDRFSI